VRLTWVRCVALAACLVSAAAAQTAYEPTPAVRAPLAAASLLLDVARAGSDLVAVGERGHILIRQGDGGWRQVDTPVQAMLTAISFHGARLGCAAGHDAVILRSDDGGAHWSIVHADPDFAAPLLDILLLDDQRGLAVGAYGLMLESTDGGQTWTRHRIGDLDLHLNAIARNLDAVLVAGEGGTILLSHDLGATWRRLPFPYEGSLHGALGLGSGRWLVFGIRGHAYRSEDDGQTWVEIETCTDAGLMGAAILDDGAIVAVGQAGVVLRSRDGAQTFTHETVEGWPGLSAVTEGSDGELLLLGEDGVRGHTP